MREQLNKLARHVEQHLATAPKCHDWDHTLRVLNNALAIAKVEGGDLITIELAAIMHDFARPEELEAKGKVCHAKIGSQLVATILPQFGFTGSTLLAHVAECVLCHRFRNNHVPQTLEAKIIFDADKLDSIGAIGIGRSFHFAGRFGAKVHNSKEAAVNSKCYSEDDTAYREFLVKLDSVQAMLYTKTGKKMGEKRHHFMQTFFQQLNSEVF